MATPSKIQSIWSYRSIISYVGHLQVVC